MLKNATFKEKFQLIQDWIPSIIEEIKKDLKNDHLRQDFVFFKKYFNTTNLSKIGTSELVDAYRKAIFDEESGEQVAELVSTRWLLKHTELYHFFEKELTQIHPEFSELEVLEIEPSKRMMSLSIEHFGAPKTYLFSVLNSVVFPEDVYRELSQKAKSTVSQKQKDEQQLHEKKSSEALEKVHEREIARLMDKYEKKLQGLQKKYLQDTEMLKKQIATLQRKLTNG